MDDREKIRERIRHLLSRTTARGCTEAEAMEAAAKAAGLMAEHGLAEGDIAFEVQGSKVKAKTDTMRLLWGTIGVCTSTAVTTVTDRHGHRVEFLGRAPGPEIAVYLREVCDRAIEREIVGFKAGTFYRRRRSQVTKRQAVADFRAGMVNRIGSRLLDLFETSRRAGAEDFKASCAERDRRMPDAHVAPVPQHKEWFAHATDAGNAAGNRPQLAHGVTGKGAAQLQIGRL